MEKMEEKKCECDCQNAQCCKDKTCDCCSNDCCC